MIPLTPLDAVGAQAAWTTFLVASTSLKPPMGSLRAPPEQQPRCEEDKCHLLIATRAPTLKERKSMLRRDCRHCSRQAT